jgi:peptidoglycan hydrolase-like protein with peptidoglycan-binding domain
VTGKLKNRLVWGKSVGPFNVSGFDLAVESLREVFTEASEYYPELVEQLSSAGMLCCRYVRGSHSAISNHSWGTAIDIKIDGNLDPYGDKKVQYGLSLLAPIFNKHGWFWGATFRKEDGMHFEVSKEKMLQWQSEGKLFAKTHYKPTNTLEHGSRGHAVLELQKMLNQIGDFNLIEDAIFGNGTKFAVIEFQTSHGLEADGVVGTQTMQKIKEVSDLPIAKSLGQKEHVTLKFGMKGRDVQIVQEKLNDFGMGLAENGDFDKLMLQAVLDFQRAFDLEETGDVDEATWNRLQIKSKSLQSIERRYPILQLGDANSEVFLLQSHLINLGYEVPTDGYFGIEMKEAVSDIQAKSAFEVTGQVNQETRDKIILQ